MGGQFTAVDLSQLPFPDAVETLDFEAILADMLSDFQTRMLAVNPSFVPLVESDPAYKVLEVVAYRELLVRQRVNDAVKAVCLAFAAGADEDQIAARFNVARLLLDPGDPSAVPPVPPTYESDDDFRRRTQLSFEGFSTAGPEGAYKLFALGADGDVLDADVQRPTPGNILVTVLSRVGDGTPTTALLDEVVAALNDEQVRPLNDTVTVQAVTNIDYTVVADLKIPKGPDPAVVLAAAQAKLDAYTASARKLGVSVPLSALYAALQQPGVFEVDLTTPAAPVTVAAGQASRCTGTTLTYTVIDG